MTKEGEIYNKIILKKEKKILNKKKTHKYEKSIIFFCLQ